MKSAIVIGGGIAGLSAAWELMCHGIQTTVLEAKSRWGGRIHTIPGKAPIELGAEFVHGRNPSLLNLISRAGLTTQQVSEEIRVFSKGSPQKVNFWDKVDSIFARIDLGQPDVSFASILKTANLSQSERTWALAYVEGFNAADSRIISAHSILRAQDASERMGGSWQARIAHGYGALILFLVNELKAGGANLLLETSVGQVDWHPGKVEVTATQKGRTTKFEANAGILTYSLGVWKAGTVSFRPALPSKAAVAQQLEFGNAVKLMLEFQQRWWDKPFGFLHAFGEPFPTWWESSEVMLTAWAAGPHADRLLHLSKDQLTFEALDSLGLMMSEQSGSLRARLANCHFKNWTADPGIRGAYSYIPVNGLELPRLLAEPIQETLFFAGEATVSDLQMGTTFGALETGFRAARQFLGQET